ICNNI
ncbi:unnamed protein product, partial [Callosobruchus maculatus]